MSFFVYIVNCAEINLKTLIVKYFEPGHTFMSADQFHHQVEKSLKRQNKVYDFNDFHQCVQKANSGNVSVIEMKKEDFFEWIDCSSKSKLQKSTPRAYLRI